MLLSALALLVTGPLAFHKDPEATLLVALWPNSTQSYHQVLRGIGNACSLDNSGMEVVRLNRSIDGASALAKLRNNTNVRYAMPYESRFGTTASLTAVKAHLEYLNAGDALHERPEGEAEEPATEWYEALYEQMQRRVNADGVIDQQAILESAAHRDKMPAAMSFATPGAPEWEYIGPTNIARPQQIYYGTPPFSGRVNCVAYDPANSAIIYAGSPGGGLWKSIDAGVTWEPLSDGWKTMHVTCVAIDPSNGNNIYVGTGDYYGVGGQGIGVMMSKDGGKTWTNTGLADFGQYTVSKIIVDRFDPTQISLTAGHGAGTLYGSGGIWHSGNSGSTWVKATGVPNTAYSDMSSYLMYNIQDPSYEDYWVVGDGAAGAILFFSYPSNWQHWISQLPPDTAAQRDISLTAESTGNSTEQFFLLEPNTSTVWAYNYTQGKYENKSSPADGNLNFPNGTAANPNYNWSQGYYDHVIAPTEIASGGGPYDVVWAGLITMAVGVPAYNGYHWTDVGATYQTSALLHSDQHALVPDPKNQNNMLIGNDGGIFRLTADWVNNKFSAVSLNKDLGITQVYQVAPHPTDPNQVIAGTQDNGCPVARGDLDNWKNADSGDGGWSAYDLVHNMIYTTEAGSTGGVARQPIAGGTMTRIHGAWAKPAAFITPLVLSNDSKFVAVGTNVLNLYDTTAGTWSSSSQNLTGGTTQAAGNFVTALATCPSDNATLYSASMDGYIYRISNFTGPARSFMRIDDLGSSPLPSKRPVNALAASYNNSADLLAGLGSSGIHHLFRCANTAGTIQWIDVSGSGSTGLPDSSVNAIARDPFQPDKVWYVGTDVGVFTTTNAGATWSNLTRPAGLPNVQVNDLKFGAGFLYAGTFGRGIWRIPVEPGTTLLSIGLTPTSVVGGQASTGHATLASAPGGIGCDVALGSSDTGAATVPQFVFVDPTQTGSDFAVQTEPVAAKTLVTITGELAGGSKTAVLTVLPPTLTAITAPASIEGGKSFVGTVKLGSAAPTDGVVVSLSSGSGFVKVPDSVKIASGSSTNFIATTASVSVDTSVVLTATFNGVSQVADIKLIVPQLVKLSLSKASAVGGTTVTGTLTISEPATLNFSASLSSSDTSAVTVPKTFAFAVGKTSATFSVVTHGVSVAKTATITASDEDYKLTATEAVTPASLLSVATKLPTVVGGNVCAGTVSLTGAAGPLGVKVDLSSNKPTIAAPPAAVTLGYTASSIGFTFTPKAVLVATSVTFSAKYGSVTKSAAFTVDPASLSSVVISPVSVTGGSNAKGTVVLNGWAPPAGAVVSLKSDSSVGTVPASVTVAGGVKAVSFTVRTKAVAATKTVHISATYGAITRTAYVTVTP